MNELHRTSVIAHILHFIRRYFLWLAIIVFIIWTAAFFEFGRYTVYQANPGLEGQEQAAQILHNVGQLIQLPTDETPTMATISDAASAKQGQPFLANAENGDVLIVYQNAGEALLYRPSTNKLIAVGPVDTSSSADATATQPPPIPTLVATSTNATGTPSKK
jgi:hypothetical protein